MRIEFAAHQDRSSYTVTEINEQEIVAGRSDRMMPQCQRAFLLQQDHRRIPHVPYQPDQVRALPGTLTNTPQKRFC